MHIGKNTFFSNSNFILICMNHCKYLWKNENCGTIYNSYLDECKHIYLLNNSLMVTTWVTSYKLCFSHDHYCMHFLVCVIKWIHNKRHWYRGNQICTFFKYEWIKNCYSFLISVSIFITFHTCLQTNNELLFEDFGKSATFDIIYAKNVLNNKII